MILLRNTSILAKHTMYQASLYSFWKNLSGHFDRFACNHSYGYAFQRIGQTVSLRFSQNSVFLWNIRANKQCKQLWLYDHFQRFQIIQTEILDVRVDQLNPPSEVDMLWYDVYTIILHLFWNLSLSRGEGFQQVYLAPRSHKPVSFSAPVHSLVSLLSFFLRQLTMRPSPGSTFRQCLSASASQALIE